MIILNQNLKNFQNEVEKICKQPIIIAITPLIDSYQTVVCFCSDNTYNFIEGIEWNEKILCTYSTVELNMELKEILSERKI